ncbi:MAG: hypothetical protein WCK09_00395 [Bacteroidota bacterium]
MNITKKTFLMSFAGNPMRYQLTPGTSGGGGGGGVPIDGVLSLIEIAFTDIDSTPDHAMTVTFMGETRTFTLKNEPTTKDHLPIADDSWTPTRWSEECLNYLMNDVQISRAYDMLNDGSNIYLTARTASPDYDWSAGSNTIVGVTVTTYQAGQVGTAGTVEGVLMQVWKNGTEKLGEDYKPVTADGSVKFEAQEYIYASLLQVPPPRFRLSSDTFFHHIYTDYFLKYRTVFCDRVAGVFLPRTYTDPDHIFCYAIAGGLNREDLVANNAALVDYFSLTATRKKFMTWSPPSKLTDKVETHSLFYAVQTPGITSIQMKAHIYNGDTGSTINITPALSVQYWSVYEFMAGYTQLNLAAQLSGNVDRWELYLVDNAGNVISDIREFVLDKRYHENTRYFRFRNSWGTYDSLRCTGVFENLVENDREKVNYTSEDIETTFNAPGAHTSISESLNYKANTGWLTKDFLQYLRDFMLSSEIFELEDGRLLKCLLTSKKTTLTKDAKYNYDLAFEYERAYNSFFFQTLE